MSAGWGKGLTTEMSPAPHVPCQELLLDPKEGGPAGRALTPLTPTSLLQDPHPKLQSRSLSEGFTRDASV